MTRRHKPEKRYVITVTQQEKELLLTLRGKLENTYGLFTTWGQFFTQLAILSSGIMQVADIRNVTQYSQYIYGVECPKCHKNIDLLRRYLKSKKRLEAKIVWSVSCRCGYKFTAWKQP